MDATMRWLGVVLVGLGMYASSAAAYDAKLKVLIVDGRNNHDWKTTTPVLDEMLEATGRFAVTVHTAPPKVDGKADAFPVRLTTRDLQPYGCILSNYNGPRWAPETEEAVEAFVAGGKGLAVVHAANNCHGAWQAYQQMLGYNWRGSGHGPKFEYDVHITDPEHPITKGVPDFWHNKDELYHLLKLNPAATHLRVLATSFSPPRMIRLKRTRKDGTKYVKDHCFGTGNDEPVVVVTDYGDGRCFHMILGHYDSSMTDNGFKTLMTRGVEWAATGKVTLPVMEPVPAAKDMRRYPEPQVVVEGLEQHLIRKEYDRLPGLFARDGQAMAKFAEANAPEILRMIRTLRIGKVKWHIAGDMARWTIPDHPAHEPFRQICCVKQGREWRIDGIQ